MKILCFLMFATKYFFKWIIFNKRFRLFPQLNNFGLFYRILLISFVIGSLYSNVQAQDPGDFRSKTDGSWSSVSTWEYFNGSSWVDATSYPGEDDVVTITAGTNVDAGAVSIGSNGTLHIDGTLVITEDLNMTENGAELLTDAGANVIIFGTANLGNKVTIDLSSYFIVLGDFLRSGSNQQGSISVTNAHIYVFGAVSSSWNDFTGCEEGTYDGTTGTLGDACDAGRFDDFIEHVDPDDLPDGIFDEIAGCTSPILDSLANQIVCENYILPVITGTNLSGNEAYFTGTEGTGATYNAGDEITNSLSLFIFDVNGYCWDEVKFDVIFEYPEIVLDYPDAHVCFGENITSLNYSSTSGNPDSFSINYEAAAESEGFLDVFDQYLSEGVISITVPTNATPQVYSAELLVKNEATGCISSVYNITVSIEPLPATGNITPD